MIKWNDLREFLSRVAIIADRPAADIRGVSLSQVRDDFALAHTATALVRVHGVIIIIVVIQAGFERPGASRVPGQPARASPILGAADSRRACLALSASATAAVQRRQLLGPKRTAGQSAATAATTCASDASQVSSQRRVNVACISLPEIIHGSFGDGRTTPPGITLGSSRCPKVPRNAVSHYGNSSLKKWQPFMEINASLRTSGESQEL